MKAKTTVDECMQMYFLEHRAKLLDLAAFLDRVERAPDFDKGNLDFRHTCFLKALKQLAEHKLGEEANRTEKCQLAFSDQDMEPLKSAAGLKGAYGAPGS